MMKPSTSRNIDGDLNACHLLQAGRWQLFLANIGRTCHFYVSTAQWNGANAYLLGDILAALHPMALHPMALHPMAIPSETLAGRLSTSAMVFWYMCSARVLRIKWVSPHRGWFFLA